MREIYTCTRCGTKQKIPKGKYPIACPACKNEEFEVEDEEESRK